MHCDINLDIDWATLGIFVLPKKVRSLDIYQDALHVSYLELHDVLCFAHLSIECRSRRVSTSIFKREQWIMHSCEAKVCLGWDPFTRLIFFSFFIRNLFENMLAKGIK